MYKVKQYEIIKSNENDGMWYIKAHVKDADAPYKYSWEFTNLLGFTFQSAYQLEKVLREQFSGQTYADGGYGNIVAYKTYSQVHNALKWIKSIVVMNTLKGEGVNG